MNNPVLRFILLSLFLCLSPSIYSITLKEVRSLGLGEITAPVTSYLNPAALSMNPASLASVSCQNNFLIHELSTLTACYQQPTRWIDFSLLLNRFGYENFNETECGINVSKLLTAQFSLGIRLYYNHLNFIDNQNSYGLFSGDIGLQYTPVDNFRIGMLLRNPFRVKKEVDNYCYELPVALFLGVEMQLTTLCKALLEVEKENRSPLCFKSAVEYAVHEKLDLRAGVLTAPLMPTFGLGSTLGKLAFDVSASYHTVLGFSPAIALHYLF